MTVLVYAIAETDETALELAGLEDQPLREVRDDRLAAIVTDRDGDGAPPAATIGTLREYEQTVERLMADRAILPARFGSVLPDEAAVRALLRRRRADLLARLERVRGAVELGLRVTWEDTGLAADQPLPESGTEYLRRRMDRRRRAKELGYELDRLASVARSCRRVLLPRPEVPLLASYLVDRGRVHEFIAVVEELDQDLEDVEVVCTGPWPPYSFVDGAPV